MLLLAIVILVKLCSADIELTTDSILLRTIFSYSSLTNSLCTEYTFNPLCGCLIQAAKDSEIRLRLRSRFGDDVVTLDPSVPKYYCPADF